MEKNMILILALLNGFNVPFLGSAINVAAPTLGVQLDLNAIELNWINTIFLLTSAICLIPIGNLADVYGKKRFLLIGNIALFLSSLIAVFSYDGFSFLLIRGIQGVCVSFSYGTSMALLTDAFPRENRGKMLGFHVTSVYTGLSLGPILGGYLVQHFGWQSIFYVPVVLSAISVLLIIFKIKIENNEFQKARKAFDYKGAFLYGLILTGLTYGFSILPDIIGYILIIMGILGFIPFLYYERKIPSPAINIELLRTNQTFKYSNLAALIHYCATTGVGFLLSLYLQYIKGLSPKEAGIALMVQPIFMAIFSPVMGSLSDKVEPRLVASIGMFLTFLGLIFLIIISDTSGMVYVYVAMVLMGIGFALFSSPNTNAAMSSVEKNNYAIASSILGTMRVGGQIFSMAIVMGIFSIMIGRVKIQPENYSAFLSSCKFAFLLFAVLCLIGTFYSMRRGNIRSIERVS